jgi:hypothetical protein
MTLAKLCFSRPNYALQNGQSLDLVSTLRGLGLGLDGIRLALHLAIAAKSAPFQNKLLCPAQGDRTCTARPTIRISWLRVLGIHLRRDTYIPQRFHASKATPYSGEHSRGFRAMARVC